VCLVVALVISIQPRGLFLAASQAGDGISGTPPAPAAAATEAGGNPLARTTGQPGQATP